MPVRLSGQIVKIGDDEYIWSSVEDMTYIKIAELERESFIGKLEKSLQEIKTLKGLIPICSYCRLLRNEEGTWEMLESYLSNHSDAQFSLGTCPECLEKELDKIRCINSKA